MPFKDPEKQRAAVRRCNKKNRAKRSAQEKAWRKKNPEASVKHQRDHYLRHSDDRRASARRWAGKNVDRVKAKARAWASENKDKVCALSSRRRARKAGALGKHTSTERKELISSYAGLCAYCGDKARTVDHVVPLAKGGTDNIDNCVPACGSCNSSKGPKSLLAWVASGGLRRERK